MRKVLIISYFYPPSFFVGGKRIAAWAEYLHESGIYPIVITRNWNPNQAEITDKVIDNSYKHQKENTHELYQLPYVYSLRDRLHQKNGWPLLRKALTFVELFLSYFFISANKTHLSFYKKTIEMLKNNPDIDTLIISGKPFQSFFIGYRLKKKFPDLKWIPDFRDEWTTYPLHKKNASFLLRILDKWAEKKWTSNAHTILATSKSSGESISKYVGKPYKTILNGFNGEIKPFHPNPNTDKIILLYIGTIYKNQHLEPYLEAAISLYKEGNPIQLHWAGIDLNPMEGKRIRAYAQKWPDLFVVHSFLKSHELEVLFQKCHFFLMSSYSGFAGQIPVKLFDYIQQNKPILLWDKDESELFHIISETNSGLAFETPEDWKKFMQHYFNSNFDYSFFKPNLSKSSLYSRRNQTKVLANYIREIN